MDIERFLKPKAIAIVGANEKPGSFGNYCALNALQNGESVRVYFVNSKTETVLGQKAYKTLSEVPEVPDAIMLAIPKRAIPGLLIEAGELGVAGAIIVAAGYSEEGTEEGHRDELEVVEIARKYDMIVMGPNCTGYVNNVDKVKLWGMGGTEFDEEQEARRGVFCPERNDGHPCVELQLSRYILCVFHGQLRCPEHGRRDGLCDRGPRGKSALHVP